jgi:hypothetical protein
MKENKTGFRLRNRVRKSEHENETAERQQQASLAAEMANLKSEKIRLHVRQLIFNGVVSGGMALGIYGVNSLEASEQADFEARKQAIQKIEPVIGSAECNRKTGASKSEQERYSKFLSVLNSKYKELWEENSECKRMGHHLCGMYADERESSLFCPYINNPQFEANFETDGQFRLQVANFVELNKEHFWASHGIQWFIRIMLVSSALGILLVRLSKLRTRLNELSERQQEIKLQLINAIMKTPEPVKTEADSDAELRQEFDRVVREMKRLLKKKNKIIKAMQERFKVKGENAGSAYRKDPATDLQMDRLQKIRVALDNGDFKHAQQYFEFVLEEAEPINDCDLEEAETKTAS